MTTTPDATSADAAIAQLVDALTLEEKVALVTGRDFWNTVPIERIGLRNMLCSDGPSGVRGERWDEREPSLNLPSSTALASSWSREVATRYGEVLAAEAHRKGVDIALGPTINLHRTPYGGRHFECMSEDPVLTAELAVAYVRGLQDRGIAACPKHYIANDFETERFTADVIVDERTLRELYLRPFEDAVIDGGTWTIMSSYNSINGHTATENDLLDTPLRSEWDFDGVVISDWLAVRSVRAATKEQDLEMPGGASSKWGAPLLDAVRAGEVDEAAIDRKVARLLRLATRVGALEIDGARPAADGGTAPGVEAVRSLAVAGTVLLRNNGILPLDRDAVGAIALLGQNAAVGRTQGGGSATVLPASISTPIDALGAILGDRMTYSIGAVANAGIVPLDLTAMTNPVTGEPGLHTEFTDADGKVLFAEDRLTSALVYFGGDAPVNTADQLTIRTQYTAPATGTINLGYTGLRSARFVVNGELVLENMLDTEGLMLGAALNAPAVTAPVEVTAGQVLDITITVLLGGTSTPGINAMFLNIGTRADNSDPDGLIAAAVATAGASEVAIVVVGTNSQVESEGFDRSSLALPGHQDALVHAVAAVNPNTIVIVNAGSPVLMPWRDEVAAILLPYFPGQEFGNAIAAMLFGDVEPGGRLPTTWPADEASLPIGQVELVDGKVAYDEGVHIGYRAWLRSGAQWAYPFGFGLGYTSWTIDEIDAPERIAPGDDITVTVGVTNIGLARGKQVVQVYAERTDTAVDRAARWLVGFATVELDPGRSADVDVRVRGREFAHWADGGWQWEPGTFTLFAGSNVVDTPARTDITVTG